MSQYSRIAFKNAEIIEVEPLAYFPQKTVLCTKKYVHNDELALAGACQETGEVLWTATVQIPDEPTDKGHVWIRSSGIYTGMLEALARIHVIEFTGRFAKVPATTNEYAYECKLLM